MVDGLFVSRLIGTQALSAINLTAPVIQLVTAVSTMLATGGSAVIMKKMGERKADEAKEDFTFLILVNVLAGLLMCGLGYLLMNPIFTGMNLSAAISGYCVDFKVLANAAANGCSEMASALVTGIITMVFNWTMLHYVGEDGVAAVTIIMYVLMAASSLYTGYSYGAAPMISYYHGEQNHRKLRKLIAVSLKVITAFSVLTALASFVLTRPLVSIFAPAAGPVHHLAVTGNRICTIALLFIGFNIFTSGMFTALSNGIVSAVLAFSRSFVFMLIAMITLPILLGVNGIWLATPAAELMALVLSGTMFFRYGKSYGYSM